jgi:Fe-S cluster assembly protein SufD
MPDASVIEAAVAPPPEGVTAALNRDAVVRQGEGEPAWLLDRRLRAWNVYERTPLPTTHLEQWRYTDLRRRLKLDPLRVAAGEALPGDPARWPEKLRSAMEEDQEASGHLVVANGRVVHVDVRADLASRGVVLTSLREAVARHPELLQRHLAEAVPPEDGKFAALNAALWSDGVFLHVPRGVELDHPVRVTRWFGEAGAAYFGRTLILAEPLSRVSYVDELLSDDLAAQTFTSTVVEVLAQNGSQVQYVALQRLGRGAFYQSQQRTLAGRDATLDTLNVTLGGTTSRVDLNARLLGAGANSDMLGLYFGDSDQHFDHNTSQDHVAPNARSDLLYKGALADRSRAVFRGIIRVHKGAQRTDAYQTNRNLLMSPHARADSLPNLEIEADDVKCSHAATVGQLDEEMLFYLLARGLSREQAERLVVLGFLGEVLRRLPMGGVVEKATRVITEKLGHAPPPTATGGRG